MKAKPAKPSLHEETGTVTLSEGRTAYAWAGPTQGRPLVLLHGFALASWMWNPVFEHLARSGFRVLRYDLYGRGASDAPPGPYPPERFVRQLTELLEALEWPSPTGLVGHSLGGVLAAHFAARHPEKVVGLVLMGAPARPVRLGGMAELLRVPWLGEWLFVRLGGPRLRLGVQKDLQACLTDAPRLADATAFLESPAHLKALYATLRDVLWRDPLPAYRTWGRHGKPTLALWGARDTVVPPEHIADLRRAIPHLQVHLISEGRHLLPCHAPEQVVAHLKAFFFRLPKG